MSRGFDTRASVVDFLRDDFGNCFQVDEVTFDHLLRCRVPCHGVSDEKVDLSDAVESQLEKSRTITCVVGRPDLELEVAQLGIEKGEKLRIVDEDVDVVAFAMIDPKHHGGAAAECPRTVNEPLAVDLTYQRAGDSK